MKKMSCARAVAYGMPGMATLFTFTMFTTYGLYFFTNIVGLSGRFAGFIMTIGTLWDAITDPLVGILSDSRNPQKGRRRPFLLISAIPFGIVTWLLFTTWNFVESKQKIYFIIVALLFYTFQTLIDVPYTSLSGEITDDYDERSKLATIRTFWAIIGVAIGGGIMFYTAFLEPIVGSIKVAWSSCFAFFVLICTLSVLVGYKASEGYEKKNIVVKEKFSLHDIIDGPLKNKPFICLALAFIFAILAQAIFLGVLVYYLTYNLQLNDMQISLVNIIMWIVALFWIFPIDYWSIKFSKKAAWIISMGIWLLCMIIFPIFFLKPHSSIAPIIMTSILVVGLNALYQVIYAMISDCVEIDELVSGCRREGLYYSMATVSQKTAAALGVSALGMVIDYVGFDSSLTIQTAKTLNGFRNIFVIGTSVCLLLSIIVMLINPLTKKKYNQVIESLRVKRKGKEISLEAFEDLLILKNKKSK